MLLSKEEFIALRIERIRASSSLYDLLDEAGHKPRWRERSGQMKCAFGATSHEREDTKPSARYYPSGERNDYESYYCFYCTERPLDAVGFVMRWKGHNFYDALRFLEHRHGIRYDDIELAKDINTELKDLAAKAKQVDPGPIFEYCELFLIGNKQAIGLKRFVALAFALDTIYYKDDKNKPDDTLVRLEKWKTAASKLVTPQE